MSGHGRLGLHANLNIRRNQPGQMKQVSNQEEAGTKLSRATGSRMLVSGLLAETWVPVGIERSRPTSGASIRHPTPEAEATQGFRPGPKVRSN